MPYWLKWGLAFLFIGIVALVVQFVFGLYILVFPFIFPAQILASSVMIFLEAVSLEVIKSDAIFNFSQNETAFAGMLAVFTLAVNFIIGSLIGEIIDGSREKKREAGIIKTEDDGRSGQTATG